MRSTKRREMHDAFGPAFLPMRVANLKGLSIWAWSKNLGLALSERKRQRYTEPEAAPVR